jgi:predicted DNA-binding protein
MEEQRKTVNLDAETYNHLKDYCDKNGLKIRWLLKKIIEEYINEPKDNKSM